MAITDAQKKAISRYDMEHTRQYHMKLNLKTDADIIAKFATVKSMQGYVKSLVREDLKREAQEASQEVIP